MLIVDYVEQCRYLRCDIDHCFEDAVTKCTDCQADICENHTKEVGSGTGFVSDLCVSCRRKHQFRFLFVAQVF
jgi:hypothetical protein